MSESAQDVGKDTSEVIISAIRPTLQFLSVFGSEDFLRTLWKKDGAPRTPKNVASILKELLVDDTKKLLLRGQVEKAAKYLPKAKSFLNAMNKVKEKEKP